MYEIPFLVRSQDLDLVGVCNRLAVACVAHSNIFITVDNNGSHWAPTQTSTSRFGATAVPQFNTPDGSFAVQKSAPGLSFGHHPTSRSLSVYAVVGRPGGEFRRSPEVSC